MAEQQNTTQQLHLEHEDKRLNAYAERIGTILAAQKKLFKIKQHLVGARDPVMFLTRTSGDIELYENVKEKEFKVPNLPEGTEKTIVLGKQWQKEIPYAGKTIRAYECHEDYAFPHLWGKPNVYQGQYPELIKTWLRDPKQVIGQYPKGIPIYLDSANVNAEAMRDRERKVLIAWEKLKARADAANWAAWAKIVLYLALGIAAILFVVKFFGGREAAQIAAATAQNISNATSGVVIIP